MDTLNINPSMPANNACPQCGTPLPSGALAGLCPACLLKMGATDDSVTDARQPAFNPPSVAELAPLFPQLDILELIGQGGMGAVYKARQKQLDRIVALKILPPGSGHDAAFAERFTREARALAMLNHPGIVTLYEFGSVENAAAATPAPDAARLFYFLMEFVDGVNLRQLLNAGRLAPREALAIVPQICDALQYAHDQGIVHRDIKPENILIDRRGRVKVADFGLAKIVGNDPAGRADLPVSREDGAAQQHRPTSDLTDAGRVMGTPKYMSPEQVTAPGEVDHRADIYALGVVFYQMLTGELPGKRLLPPSSKVQIDVRLDEVVLRAMEKNPALRYQQVSEVKTLVETIAATPPGSSRHEEAQSRKASTGKPGANPVTPAATNPPPRSGSTGKVFAIGCAVLALVGLLVLALLLALLFFRHHIVHTSQPAPPPVPVALWSAENSPDDTAGHRHSQLEGHAGYAPGIAGQAFAFQARGDGVSASAAGLPAGTSDRTLACWVYIDSVIPDEPFIASYGQFGVNGQAYGLGLNLNRHVFFSQWGQSLEGPALYAGRWYHLAVTSAGTNDNKLYVDSVVVASGPLSFNTPANGQLHIGCLKASFVQRQFIGRIDEVAVYDRALTATEINVLYNNPKAPPPLPPAKPSAGGSKPRGLIGSWSGSSEGNDTVAGNNGVLQNVTLAEGVTGPAFVIDPARYNGAYCGVQIPDQPAYALTKSLSVVGWIRPRGLGYKIIERGDRRPGIDPFSMQMDAENNLGFGLCAGDGIYASVQTHVDLGAWIHAAATLDDRTDTLSFYTNGVLAAQLITKLRPIGPLDPDQHPGIGIGNVNDGGNNFPFAGEIDGIALYDRALTAKEIKADYVRNAANARAKAGPFPPQKMAQPSPIIRTHGPVMKQNSPPLTARQQLQFNERITEMRQFLIGVLMYKEDNANRWPGDLTQIFPNLTQTFPNLKGFSPEQLTANALAYRYQTPPTNLDERATANTPVLLERKLIRPDGQYLGYADGHVAFVAGTPFFRLCPSTMPTNWAARDSFGKDRYSAQGKTVKELITRVWSQKNSTLKIIFAAELPEDRYDFTVTGQPQWWDTLQAEIDRRFHLVETIENRDGTDVVVVKKQMQDAVTFGPVVERTVYEYETGKDWLLNFQTGETFRPPASLTWEKNFSAIWEWAHAHGAHLTGLSEFSRNWHDGDPLPVIISLVHGYGPPTAAERGLFAFEMKAVIVPAESGGTFETVTPPQLADALRNQPFPLKNNPSGGPSLPQFASMAWHGAKWQGTDDYLYAFQTDDGQTGLLQITGFTDKPRGVKLRYKLVQANAPASATQTGVTSLKADAGATIHYSTGEIQTGTGSTTVTVSYPIPPAVEGVDYVPIKPAPVAGQADSVIPVIHFVDVTLVDAVESLARQMQLNYVIDPNLLAELQVAPTLSIRWENLTARQALTAILESRALQLQENPQTGVARIVKITPATAIQTKSAGPNPAVTFMPPSRPTGYISIFGLVMLAAALVMMASLLVIGIILFARRKVLSPATKKFLMVGAGLIAAALIGFVLLVVALNLSAKSKMQDARPIWQAAYQPLLRVTVRVLDAPGSFDDAQLLRPSGLLDSGEVKILAAPYVVVPSGNEGEIQLNPIAGLGNGFSQILSGRTRSLFIRPTLQMGSAHVTYSLEGLIRDAGPGRPTFTRQAIRSGGLMLGEMEVMESNGLPNGRRQLAVISVETEVLKVDAAGRTVPTGTNLATDHPAAPAALKPIPPEVVRLNDEMESFIEQHTKSPTKNDPAARQAFFNELKSKFAECKKQLIGTVAEPFVKQYDAANEAARAANAAHDYAATKAAAEQLQAAGQEIGDLLKAAAASSSGAATPNAVALKPIPPEAAAMSAALKEDIDSFWKNHDQKDPAARVQFNQEMDHREMEFIALLRGTVAEPLVKQQLDLVKTLAEKSKQNSGPVDEILLAQLEAVGKQLDAMLLAAAPNMATARQQLQFNERLVEMRKFLMGIRMYYDDHANQWPDALAQAVSYLKGFSPERVQANASAYRYQRPAADFDVKDAATTPVLFEQTPLRPDTQCIGYADGHVAYTPTR